MSVVLVPTIHCLECTLWTVYKSVGWDIFSSVSFMIHRYPISQEFPGNYISKCHCSNVRRRCGSHKSESEASLEGRDLTLRRKLPHLVLDSQNQSNNMQSYPSLATTSLPRKVRNGKNIEKYQHLLFPM